MDSVNLFRAENTEGRIDVGKAVGSSATLMFIYDIRPGERQCPYHYEYNDEWLLVVEGTLVLRAPDGEHILESGDLIRFPAGPEGAHELINRSESPTRTLMFSSSRSPAVSVYPDTDELTFTRETAIPWARVWETPASEGE